MSRTSKSAFTLIELLVVLALVAVLSTVVVVTLNPAELIKQARDSTRISDLNTINTALGTFAADVTSAYVGTSSVVYVSLPDSSPTCANLGLPTLPGGWVYNCVTAENHKKTDGTGWIPANLSRISFGTPLEKLPIDPKNSTSTGLYYTFVTTGSWWELTSILESDKYGPRMVVDGGASPNAFEQGTDLTLTPVEALDRGVPPDLTVPSIASISPTSATAGDPPFTLTVIGENFTSSSVVNWGASAKTTTFISTTQLTASILAGDISASGTIAVTVYDPVKGTSGLSNFAVEARVVFAVGNWTTDSTGGLTQGFGSSITEVGGTIYVLVGGGTSFSSYNPTSKVWTTLASTTAAVGSGASITKYDNDTLYASRGAENTSFWKYTISSNTWTPMASTPAHVTYGGSLSYPGTGDFIYATGGGTTNFWRYSVSDNSWTTNGTAEGAGASIAEVSGELYVFAGNSTTFRKYNPTTQAWTTLASTDAAVGSGASITKYNNDTLYAYRGAGTTSFWKYTISSNTWASMASTSIAIGAGGSVSYPGTGDYIYGTRGGSWSDFWRYSVTDDSWSANGTAEGVGASITEVNGSLYVFAGNSTTFRKYNPTTQAWTTLASTDAAVGSGASITKYNNDTLYAYRGAGTTSFWKYTISSNTWASMASTSIAIGAGGSVSYPGTGDYIYGTRGGSWSDFWRYSISGDSWSTLASTPFGIRGGSSLVALDSNTLYTTGRFGSFGKYTISTGIWETKTSSPVGVGGISPLATDGINIYQLTGSNSSGFYRYNVASNTWSAALATTTMGMGDSSSDSATRGAIVYSSSLGLFFAISGNSPGNLGSVISYDKNADAWSLTGYRGLTTPFGIRGGSSLVALDSNTLYTTGRFGEFGKYTISTGIWETKTSSPVGTGGISPLATDGINIYQLSGSNSSGFYRYNVVSNTWSAALATTTIGMGDSSNPDYITKGGIVYSSSLGLFFAISGNSPGSLGSIISYNKNTDAWSFPGYRGLPLPFDIRGGSSLRALNSDTLYVNTGNSGGSGVQFAKYTISTGAWEMKASSPVGFIGISALASDGTKIYALAGGNTTAFYSYDPTANTWSSALATTTMGMGDSSNPDYITKGGMVYSQTHNSLFAIPGSGGYILKNTQ